MNTEIDKVSTRVPNEVCLIRGRPKIICLCGSSRFCDISAVKAWEFEKQGSIAIGMHFLPAWYPNVQPDHMAEHEGVAAVLDYLHLYKIEMSDMVFVVNQGGYIGERTKIEIAHAEKLGKPVEYLEAIVPKQRGKCSHGVSFAKYCGRCESQMHAEPAKCKPRRS